jgi:hypothetical protein
MRKNIFMIIILFLSISLIAKAQDYIITSKGDSISGKVKIEKIGTEKRIYVTANDKKKSNYTILQFRKAVIKGETFVPFKRGETFDIVKVIQEGYLSLYAFQLETQNTYDGLYLAKRDGESLEVPNLQFKKHVSRLVSDCPFVKERIESNEFKRHELSKIIELYNSCVQERTNTYYKQTPVSSTPLSNINSWNELKLKIEQSDLKDKENLLEMLEEIKAKKAKNEKLPKFLLDSFNNGIAQNEEIKKMFEHLVQ